MTEEQVATLRRWIVSQAEGGRTVLEVWGGLAERIAAAGVPLWRMSTALLSFDPEIVGAQLAWVRGAGVKETLRTPQQVRTQTYVGSPAEAVQRENREIRCRLDVPDEKLPFPMLLELRAQGGTDYLIFPVALHEAMAASAFHIAVNRAFISFTSDDAKGFTQAQVDGLRSVLPEISLRLSLETSKRSAESLLRAYLGANAARRVLAGKFQRGGAEAIQAVIWYCDMAGFTAMSDSRPGRDVVRVLDRYFDCMATPVEEQGGEVLKFIGDAALAIFTIGPDGPVEPCRRALAAVAGARTRLAALNVELAAAGEPPLGCGIAMHVGEVMYGNIGARGRLDFTVIGAPVNEVCRVEALTRTLGGVLLTEEFVQASGLTGAVSRGQFTLKGVSEPRELFSPPPGIADPDGSR